MNLVGSKRKTVPEKWKSNGWGTRESYLTDITVVTALFDGRMTGIPHTVVVYDPTWVDKLYRGIARNYKGMFELICLTDQRYRFKEPIKQIRFERSVDQYGWMSLIEMYRPDLTTGKRFTIGLDTIITGPLNNIFNYNDKIALCTDPFIPQTVCNAVTMCNSSFCEEYWNMWKENEYELIKESKLEIGTISVPSEMSMLRKYYGKSPRLDEIFPGSILSYKQHIMDKPHHVLANSSIVYFHGVPKPHKLVGQGGVRECWR